MEQIPNEMAAVIAYITEKTRFTCYPLPQQILFDRGTKLMAKFSKICQNEYVIKRKPITNLNPYSNTIIEQIHQNIDVSKIINNNPW